MNIDIGIEKLEDVELAFKLLSAYGEYCNTWTIKGTVWVKEEDD